MTNPWMATGRSLVTGTMLALLALPGRAVAAPQEAGPPPGEAQPAKDAPSDAGLAGNEIVVTATKREQTLQDVPVAVTVTTADTIAQAKIRDIKDLSSVVPSLRVVDHQNVSQTAFLIRGFGNGDNNVGVEPSVGVFIDGVYRSRSAAQIADFPDVKRVEVLRGPQSTLFGKNASAGVVSIVTEEPKFTPTGNAEVSYGNHNAVVAKAAFSGPVSQDLAVGIAGGYNRRDGYAHDATTGHDMNERNRWFVRGQLLYAPGTQLRVRIIGDYGRIDENCCAVVNVHPSAATGVIRLLGGQVNPAATATSDTVYNNFDSTNRIRNYGISGQVDYALGPITLTSITAWRGTDNVTGQDSDFTSLDLLGRNDANVRIRTFTQELRAATTMDGPLNFLVGGYFFHENIAQDGALQFGQDARAYANVLAGGTPGTVDRLTQLEAGFAQLQGLPVTTYLGKFFQAGTGLTERYALHNTAFSVFGQFDFKIGSSLTLTGGINYTHDAKRFETGNVSTDVFSGIDIPATLTGAGIAQTVGGALGLGRPASAAEIAAFAGANGAAYSAIQKGVAAAVATNPLLALRQLQFLPPFLNVPNPVESGRTKDGNVSYTARLAWKASSHINLYASVATGFKASSINLSRDSRPALADFQAINAAGLGLANLVPGSRYAGPEKSTVYEAGLKANWGLATLNVAAFKESIKGFQTNIFTGTGFVLGNAGKESVTGFEVEGTVRPVPELTLAESLTYLKPKYDSYVQSPFGDASGLTPAGIAPLSLTLAATWDHPLANGDHVILRGDWHYESPVQIEDGLPGYIVRNPLSGAVITNQPGLDAARAYRREVSEIDASLSWRMHNGLEIGVWGRNLTNNRYMTVVFDSPLQPGSVSAYLNQPRMYGGSVSFRF